MVLLTSVGIFCSISSITILSLLNTDFCNGGEISCNKSKCQLALCTPGVSPTSACKYILLINPSGSLICWQITVNSSALVTISLVPFTENTLKFIR